MSVNVPSSTLPEPQNTGDSSRHSTDPNAAPTTSVEPAVSLPERPAEPKISKGAAKKEAKKAANKAIKQESKKEAPSKPPKPTPSTKAQDGSLFVEDPDYMFRVGFLADVYKERPAGSPGINGVVTRCGSTCLSKR